MERGYASGLVRLLGIYCICALLWSGSAKPVVAIGKALADRGKALSEKALVFIHGFLFFVLIVPALGLWGMLFEQPIASLLLGLIATPLYTYVELRSLKKEPPEQTF